MIRLLLFLIISVITVGGTSMAENVSTCSVDMVPIQLLKTRGPSTIVTLSVANESINSGTPSFNNLVTAVTEHLEAKLAQEKLCLNSMESKERSLVKFAYLTISTAEDDYILSALQPLEAQHYGVCRISSPWVDIAVEREPVPSVQAIVRFSERQFLADQALMAGAQNVTLGAAKPLTHIEYGHYISEYTFTELPLYIIKERRERNIEELVPPDVLWLLARTPSGGPGPFSGSINGAMRSVVNAKVDGYTQIITALIDQCLASDGADIQYNSVLEVADLIHLEQYKNAMPALKRPRPAHEK